MISGYYFWAGLKGKISCGSGIPSEEGSIYAIASCTDLSSGHYRCFVFRTSGVEILPQKPAPLIEVFMIFVDISREMPKYYLQLSRNRFLPHPFQFIFD
jgi:hypothetical protein